MAKAADLAVPLDCRAGVTCFVQQYPDFDQGPGAVDPFCGTKTYDGHDGTDIRVLSMADVARGVPVLALGEGRVLRGRDGVPDRLVRTEEDRAAVADRECGNGLVVELEGGLEAQYCHLKQGSIAVRPGQTVAAGDVVGMVGASGNAQFPHVHLTLRRGGTAVDPATGRTLAAGCLLDPAKGAPLWGEAARDWLKAADDPILAIGLSGAPPSYDRLVEAGPPADLKAGDGATVGWGWFSNLVGGDRVHIVITAPDGSVLSDTTSEALDRSKAAFLQFSGRKRPPQPGIYRLAVEVLRAGRVVAQRQASVDIDG
ncbi:peptidoglycan DD-metalloendopeptidase family protein [Aurantimonas sp. 22II-16-19i]|uniref:peptidoglycan DD-metalloendopeptidase family protein n=1 Tax=Aurantimonas sp. 22II-16-19i TaxID=1317114 RepID=UPI0009F7D235|nr:peptidoglycan DD-metalloendopeptidase family protein [Aurantimonas sp. 22II-16-19i]ORE94822.1 Peptidase M23 [Aurantimonas sp. 22II-16-19i]